MASQFDESDFIDRDFQGTKSVPAEPLVHPHAVPGASAHNRPPTREELDAKVGAAQQRLAELKRAQEELERERAALEEARRRRVELQTGREEMTQNLTRGIGLLEEAEFAARRDAEQMARTLVGLREALAKVQAIHEETWNQESWNVELTRALTAIENSRMEWNSARLKWELLNGLSPAAEANRSADASSPAFWGGLTFWQASKLGLALTWPLLVLGAAALVLAAIRTMR